MEKCPWEQTTTKSVPGRGVVCNLRTGLSKMEDDEETVCERKKHTQMVDVHVDELMENMGVEILCAEVEILCADKETLSEWKIYMSDAEVSIYAALEQERHVEVRVNKVT